MGPIPRDVRQSAPAPPFTADRPLHWAQVGPSTLVQSTTWPRGLDEPRPTGACLAPLADSWRGMRRYVRRRGGLTLGADET